MVPAREESAYESRNMQRPGRFLHYRSSHPASPAAPAGRCLAAHGGPAGVSVKAAIYCRLSKEDEFLPGGARESESIQNQRAMLLDYARQHGYEVAGIYTDEDYSGMDRSRPGFNQLITAARRREFEVILVKTQSRFTRDMELVEKYLHGLFPLWGIRLIAVVDHVDTADLAGKKSRQINGLINEWYLEDLSANVRSVLTHKRRAGQYIGAFALYGYAKDPADHNRLVIDPEAAGVVRRIFGWYLAGYGTARIARMLNAEGILPPGRYRQQKEGLPYYNKGASGQSWTKATVHRLLTTRTYAGDLEQGRHRRVSYKSPRTVWLPRRDWIVVPGTHQALIPPDDFARVQQLLASRARSGAGGQVHPLAGRVFCALCGRGMEQTSSGHKGKDGQRVRYFRCRTALTDKARCPGQPYLPAAAVEQAVLAGLRRYLGPFLHPEDPALFPALPGQSARRAERTRLQGELARRDTALESLYLDKCSGLLEEGQFLILNRRLQQESSQLKDRLRALDAAPDGDAARAGMQARLREAASLSRLDRALVSLTVEKILVFPPEEASGPRPLEIHWKF